MATLNPGPSLLVLSLLFLMGAGRAADETVSCVYAARKTEKNPIPERQELQPRGECATLRRDGSLTVHSDHLHALHFGDGLAAIFRAHRVVLRHACRAHGPCAHVRQRTRLFRGRTRPNPPIGQGRFHRPRPCRADTPGMGLRVPIRRWCSTGLPGLQLPSERGWRTFRTARRTLGLYRPRGNSGGSGAVRARTPAFVTCGKVIVV